MIGEYDTLFLRGDANGDTVVDISDPVAALGFLFTGSTRPPCLDSSDANDDGRVDIADPIYLLSFLFQGGPHPRSPGTLISGSDRTVDSLHCGEAGS
jgi:hypothetical protein